MENMRIGIDCHNLEGQRTGVGRYLTNLLRNWESQTEIDFFLYFKNEIPKDLYYIHDREYNREHNKRWNFKILHGRSNALFKHWQVPRAAKKDAVDILFCPDYVLPFFVDSRIKTAVTMHDIIYEARPNEYSWPSVADRILLKWASKRSAKKADIIFVPSEFTKSEILKYYKINPQKVCVTPLAADPQFKKIDMPGEKAAEELSVGALEDWERIRQKYHIQDRFIFFVGSIFNRRFLPQKIKGFAMFAKDNPEFKFLIIGNNRTKPFQDIGAHVAEANTKLGREAVVWKERANDDELVYLYNGAFATLWLSSYEGFGLPILESMACGTPVITSRGGSLPEVGGDAALYVEHPENPEEIASILSCLIQDKSSYLELLERGLTWARKFSWQKTAQQTIDKILNL